MVGIIGSEIGYVVIDNEGKEKEIYPKTCEAEVIIGTEQFILIKDGELLSSPKNNRVKLIVINGGTERK